jgi:large-conductance mechanosensitive channel
MINAILTFVITLTVIYLVIVAPMNKVRGMTGKGEIDPRPADVVLLTEIRDLLKENQQK